MLPEVRGKGRPHRMAIDVAWKSLEGRDARKLASESGSVHSGGHLLLPFFHDTLTVVPEKKQVQWEGKEADDTSIILALHYLAGCGPDVPKGVLVPFNQAEGGDAYYGAFKLRVIDRLAAEFGQDPASLVKAGISLGGMDVAHGSAAVEVRAFPKIVVTLIVWEGDEEVPPSANVLFDSTALHILPTEDLAVLGSLTISRLVKAKNSLSSGR